MPAYKRQHYLPAAYLKYFSIDQTHCARDSWVWRFDGQGQQRVRVDSQCAANYFYSKENAALAEAMFQKIENRYCECIDRIRQGRKPSSNDYGTLLLGMFDFYIRNAVHQNDTGKEGIEAYRKRTQIFWEKILLIRTGTITTENIQDHLNQCWQVRIVTAPADRVFVTSDSPSVWTSINKSQHRLDLLTLPITPTLTAIAYDTRILDIVSQQASYEDYLTLNGAQIESFVTCMYASIEIPENQISIMKDHFSTKVEKDCIVGKNHWRLALAGLPPEHYFSFIRFKPPLM